LRAPLNVALVHGADDRGAKEGYGAVGGTAGGGFAGFSVIRTDRLTTMRASCSTAARI